MPRIALLLTVVLTAAACSGGSGSDADPRTTGTQAERPTVVIHTDEGEHELVVEIADSDAERARGLMGRTSLREDAGMVFVYPEKTAGGYWMKNTLIPLSIAFYDTDGTILRILDMEPCEKDPCPVYDPGVAYAGALEVNQGTFARLGVDEGDRVELKTA